MLLCDWAEAVEGKLYAQGGGWTHLLIRDPSEPVSMAVGLVVAVPWTEANKRHALELNLRTEDGQQVQMGDHDIKAGGQIEVGRPPGIKPGIDLNAVLAFNFTALQLPPGGYVWRLSIGEESCGRAPFWVLSPQGGPA